MQEIDIKEDLRTKRTNSHLSNTLIEMLQESSMKKISVSDICDKAMVHRTTFYKHFEDKYHLLSYAFETLKDAMFKDVEYNAGVKGLENLALDINKAVLDFLSEKQIMVTNILKHNNDEKFFTIIRESFERNLKEFLVEIKNNQDIVYDVPINVVASFIVGGFSNLILWHLKNPKVYTINELYKFNEILVNKLIPT